MSGSKHSTYRDFRKALEDEENPEIDYDQAVKRSNTIGRELYIDYLLINYPNDPQVERVNNKLFPSMN